MSSILTTFAPPFKIIGGYFLVGLIFLASSTIGYFLADFNVIVTLPTAGFLHLFLIGFVISIIIGALYQLTSVIIEKNFYSIKFAMPNLILYGAGIFLLVFGFFMQNINLLHIGGVLLFISLGYFIICFLLSFKGSNVNNFAFLTLFIGGVFLAIGIIFGLFLLFETTGFFVFYFIFLLSYHLYFVLGFIYFIILGASSILIPMFALSHKVSFMLYYISFGLYLCAGAILWYDYNIFFILTSISIISFIAQIFLILKKRVRKAWDYWNLNIIISLLFLFVSGILYLFEIKSWIFTLLFGFLYAFTIAHIYKIAPFLVWYHYVSPFVGKMKVPMLEDMIIKNIAFISLIFNVFGVICAILQLEILAIICIFISIVLVIINIINIFKYTKFGKKGYINE